MLEQYHIYIYAAITLVVIAWLALILRYIIVDWMLRSLLGDHFQESKSYIGPLCFVSIALDEEDRKFAVVSLTRRAVVEASAIIDVKYELRFPDEPLLTKIVLIIITNNKSFPYIEITTISDRRKLPELSSRLLAMRDGSRAVESKPPTEVHAIEQLTVAVLDLSVAIKELRDVTVQARRTTGTRPLKGYQARRQ